MIREILMTQFPIMNKIGYGFRLRCITTRYNLTFQVDNSIINYYGNNVTNHTFGKNYEKLIAC